MARLRVVKRIEGATLEPGLELVSPGPVSEAMHGWLLAGTAELLLERVPEPPDDNGEVPPQPRRR